MNGRSSVANGSSLETLAHLLTEKSSQASEHITLWHVLDGHGFDMGCFLACWRVWISQSEKDQRLFYTACLDTPSAIHAWLPDWVSDPILGSRAQLLARHWWGLLPGTHRLVFDEGRVQLTLHVGQGDRLQALCDRPFDAIHAVQGSGGCGDRPPSTADLHKLARLCRFGTRLVWQRTANPEQMCTPGKPWGQEAPEDPDSEWCVAVYRPTWPVGRSWRQGLPVERRQAVVIGAGLAGSAAAWSLAQRGWKVDVVDAGDAPAQGASGLPAGLFAPHVTSDDSPLSQLSRDGVRATRSRAEQLLKRGAEWAPSGVLEHHVETARSLPLTDDEIGGYGWLHDWSQEAKAEQLKASGLDNRRGLWHASAGWIRPSALVRAQLQHPRIHFRGGLRVHSLTRGSGVWYLWDANHQQILEAPVVVLAAGYAVRQLMATLPLPGFELPFHALRGQVTYGPLDALAAPAAARRPPWPVNGHGSFLSGIPDERGRLFWIVGSTFEREMAEPILKATDQYANLERLGTLLPPLEDAFNPAALAVQAWAGVRCTVPDRLPAVGALDPIHYPGLHILTGLGARGLTLSVLCGEVLAAQIEGEPWPTHTRLAKKLLVSRFVRSTSPS